MKYALFSALALASIAPSLGGCGGDDVRMSPDASTDTGSGGEDAGDVDGGPITAAEVPAERLVADPATDCPAAFQSSAPAAGNNSGFEAAGQTRSFYVIPAATGEGPRPLFVAFNGTGEHGQGFSSRARLLDFAARGFLVVAPDSAGNGTVWPVWDSMREPGREDDPNPDLEYFDRLVMCVAAHFEVDRNRIYIGGHSAGGIMTNYVLRRRSELLAGGIVASGVFSLTGPAEPMPLEETFALVTWGGMNDVYSGGAGGVAVPEINFVEQASLASQFYAAEPAVGQARCSAEVGHAWLSQLNDWFVDVLLEHPKGVPGATDLVLPPVPSGSGATCRAEPFVYEPTLMVSCPDSVTAGCYAFCQLAADCVVENGTVGPVLAPQVTMLGFSGDMNAECGGCVTRCESMATSASDTAALGCLATAQSAAMCGGGIEGARPFIDAVNTCCEGRTDSPFCVDVCTIIRTNSVAGSFFPTCEALAP